MHMKIKPNAAQSINGEEMGISVRNPNLSVNFLPTCTAIYSSYVKSKILENCNVDQYQNLADLVRIHSNLFISCTYFTLTLIRTVV